jgi:hypothetical protein
VDNLVKQINAYQHLRELDQDQKDIDKQFQELKRDLLPPNKDKEISAAVTNQKNNL